MLRVMAGQVQDNGKPLSDKEIGVANKEITCFKKGEGYGIFVANTNLVEHGERVLRFFITSNEGFLLHKRPFEYDEMRLIEDSILGVDSKNPPVLEKLQNEVIEYIAANVELLPTLPTGLAMSIPNFGDKLLQAHQKHIKSLVRAAEVSQLDKIYEKAVAELEEIKDFIKKLTTAEEKFSTLYDEDEIDTEI